MKNRSDVVLEAGDYRIRAERLAVVVEKQNPVSRVWHIFERFRSVADAMIYLRFITAHERAP